MAPDVDFDQDIEEFTKESDLGGTLGMIVDLGGGSPHFVLDLRYTMGTNTIDDIPLDEIYQRHHNGIQAMVGIGFGGGRN